MQEKTSEGKVFHIRLTKLDLQAIGETAKRMDLSKSEIARRALRVGLAAFTSTELPGGKGELDHWRDGK